MPDALMDLPPFLLGGLLLAFVGRLLGGRGLHARVACHTPCKWLQHQSTTPCP